MTNKDKVINTLSELLYNACKYDEEYCPKNHECEYGDDVAKENCLECINKWLEREAER